MRPMAAQLVMAHLSRTARGTFSPWSPVGRPDWASFAGKDGPYAPGMSEEMMCGHLGRSGLLVSRIGLGTMNFGYAVDESSSSAVMDAAIDAGINFFDTADVYGGPQSPWLPAPAWPTSWPDQKPVRSRA